MTKIFPALLLTAVLLTLPGEAYADGTAPVAQNLELCTYKNVTVSGKLSAFDSENDVVMYEITTPPVKGSVELCDDGSFIYTPNKDKKGRDYFGYKALDAEGNRSQEATVIIKIEKQKKQVSYADMDGLAGEYYAAALSEAGIFTGENICGKYCFYPERTVTRGEFVSMCIRASGEPIVGNVMSTGLSDDGSIPDWMKSYVMASVMCGQEYENKIFDAEEGIGRTEALLLLNNALGINDVSYLLPETALSSEASQACANLRAVGLICEGELKEETLTRIEAAELIVKALELVKNR